MATGDYTAWNKFEKEMAATMAANAKANAAANSARLDAINDLAVFEQELINDKKKAADDEAKEAAKMALLDRLGMTAEEAKLLLS